MGAGHLQALSHPFIVKIGFPRMPDAEQAVGEMTAVGVQLVYANVGQTATARGQDLVRRLKAHGVFLLVGGGIRTVEDARVALDAGADAVAVGIAAMQDPTLCGRLQAVLRQTGGP